MTSDLKFFSVMLSRQLSFYVLSAKQLFYVYYKKQAPLFFNLQLLLFLRERGLSPESCLAISVRGLVAYKPVAYKKK